MTAGLRIGCGSYPLRLDRPGPRNARLGWCPTTITRPWRGHSGEIHRWLVLACLPRFYPGCVS
jgi:hypothetical protein